MCTKSFLNTMDNFENGSKMEILKKSKAPGMLYNSPCVMNIVKTFRNHFCTMGSLAVELNN